MAEGHRGRLTADSVAIVKWLWNRERPFTWRELMEGALEADTTEEGPRRKSYRWLAVLEGHQLIERTERQPGSNGCWYYVVCDQWRG